MSDETTTLAPRDIGPRFSLQPTSVTEAIQLAKMIAASDLAPKDYKGKPENVLIAVQMGAELGLSPMQACQNIAVIGGRPAVFGDAMLAICQAAPDFVDLQERGNSDEATCTVIRRGREPITRHFSVTDAKRAGLWGKQGPWIQYPDRMLQMRARGFALRDAYADRLRGIISVEEARDIPADPVKVSLAPAPLPKATKPATVPPTPSYETRVKSVTPKGEQVTRGLRILDTIYVAAKGPSGAYTEIYTSNGVFATTNEEIAKSAATCIDTDHQFAVTWKPTKRRTGEIVRLVLLLELDEEPPAADEQTGLPL